MPQKDTRTYKERTAAGQGSEDYRRLKRRSVAMPNDLWEKVDELAKQEGIGSSPWIRRVVADAAGRPDLAQDDDA